MNEKKIRAAQVLIIAGIVPVIVLSGLFGKADEAKDSAHIYTQSSDLNGQPLAVVTGSEYAEFAAEAFPDSELIHVTDWADTAILVAQGKAEGF